MLWEIREAEVCRPKKSAYGFFGSFSPSFFGGKKDDEKRRRRNMNRKNRGIFGARVLNIAFPREITMPKNRRNCCCC